MHSETIDDEIRSYLESSNVRELQDLVAIAEKANPLWLLLQRAYTLMLCLYRRLSRILDDAQTEYRLYTDEPLLVVLQRWRRLCTKFYHAETHRFSVSAVCSTPIHLERNQAHHSLTHSLTSILCVCTPDSHDLRLHQVRCGAQSARTWPARSSTRRGRQAAVGLYPPAAVHVLLEQERHLGA